MCHELKRIGHIMHVCFPSYPSAIGVKIHRAALPPGDLNLKVALPSLRKRPLANLLPPHGVVQALLTETGQWVLFSASACQVYFQ